MEKQDFYNWVKLIFIAINENRINGNGQKMSVAKLDLGAPYKGRGGV